MRRCGKPHAGRLHACCWHGTIAAPCVPSACAYIDAATSGICLPAISCSCCGVHRHMTHWQWRRRSPARAHHAAWQAHRTALTWRQHHAADGVLAGFKALLHLALLHVHRDYLTAAARGVQHSLARSQRLDATAGKSTDCEGCVGVVCGCMPCMASAPAAVRLPRNTHRDGVAPGCFPSPSPQSQAGSSTPLMSSPLDNIHRTPLQLA